MDDQNAKALEYIEDVTSNAGEVQARVLGEILRRSAHAEYLQLHGLAGCADLDSFKKHVPIVTYEDLKPYVDRIANGDTSAILCADPISEFLTSSGTSGGERKLMPTTEDESERRSLVCSLVKPIMSQFIPDIETGKGMYFLFTKAESKTPSGHLARPALTSYYKSPQFLSRRDPYTNYTSPNEAILCPDPHQSMYAHLLCGLCQRSEVLRVGAVFASGFLRAIKFLERHWASLAADIRAGTLRPEIDNPAVRDAVARILRPDPGLADLVEAQCGGATWRGIITRLWPNTKYIDVIVTGTMSQYIPAIDEYSGGLPIVCIMYASSECYFGLNLDPLCEPGRVAYTLIPTMAYFEFLPARTGSAVKEELVDLVDVKVGEEYELVITTYSGLYRYRVGDILRVSGFKNKAPQFNFVCRKNVVLSIDSDKTDEVELHRAVTEAAQKHLRPHGAALAEYTALADTSTIPGHYVLFWELTEPRVPPSVLRDCCLAVEESLNSVYRQCRASDNSIGPLEIRVVENGTFDALMDHALANGASISQYKAPRCVKDSQIVRLLNSRVVESYFSPACPSWAPGNKL